jgi:hypothetical protein
MISLTLRLKGLSPMLMHSDRYANPLDPDTKEHKRLTSKRKKTDEDHAAIAYSEWKGGLYFDERLGPYLPSINVRSCLVEGAKLNKLGAAMQRGTIILEDKLALKYSGPRTIDGLWGNARFRDCRSVVVSRQRLMRYRPCFPEWEAELEITFDPQIIEADQILQSAENAGKFIGLGDFRPNKGGSFGRFEVETI